MSYLVRVGAAAGAMLVLLVLPVTAFAGHGHKTKHTCATKKPAAVHRIATTTSSPVITFGIRGGNIMPWSVTIDGDGTVTGAGWVHPRNTLLMDPTTTLNGFVTLANAVGFFSMPATTSCSGTLPDVASRYITMNTTSGTKEVKVHGGCVAGFNQLFGALENAADFQHAGA